METLFLSLLSPLILVAALSVDAFVASFAYGADKIQIPFSSIMIICGVCSGTLGFSLLAGKLIHPFLTSNLTHVISFIILFLLGLIKLFESVLKNLIKRHQSKQKKLRFRLAGIRFILQIYVDSTAADKDASRRLSPGEAASLAIALSLDGLAVGIGAGISQTDIILTLFFSCLTTGIAVWMGGYFGKHLAKKLHCDLNWLSGILLILLACIR